MVPAEQLLIFDETTGQLPALATTAGTFRYYASAATSFVDQVLIEAENTNWQTLQTLSLQDYGKVSPNAVKPEYYTIAGIQYLRVPYIRTWPASESQNAKILFTKDPGTRATAYRLRSYRKPDTLDSDSIELTVPPPYDELYLLPATAKLIEGVINGNYIEARLAITREFKPLMWKAFNEGEQGQDLEPESRGF